MLGDREGASNDRRGGPRFERWRVIAVGAGPDRAGPGPFIAPERPSSVRPVPTGYGSASGWLIVCQWDLPELIDLPHIMLGSNDKHRRGRPRRVPVLGGGAT